MNVFFDTNVLDRIDLRGDVGFQKVLEYCQAYGQKIYLSDVVLLELVHHRIHQIDTIKKFLKDWNPKFKAIAGEIIRDDIPELDVQAQLTEVLRNAGVIFVTNEGSDVGLAVEAMYTGRKPAKGRPGTTPSTGDAWDSQYTQSGMKDVFIWRSFLRLIQTKPHESFAFVTTNTRDFVDAKDRSDEERKKILKHEFHPDLCSDLGGSTGRIVCLNGIHAVRHLHINPIEDFDGVKALDILNNSQDILADMFSQMNLDPETPITRVQKVFNKAVQAFSTFTCTAEVALVIDSIEKYLQLQLALDYRNKGYELRAVHILAE